MSGLNSGWSCPGAVRLSVPVPNLELSSSAPACSHACLIKTRPVQPACYKSLRAVVFWRGLCASRFQAWRCAGFRGAGQAMDRASWALGQGLACRVFLLP